MKGIPYNIKSIIITIFVVSISIFYANAQTSLFQAQSDYSFPQNEYLPLNIKYSSVLDENYKPQLIENMGTNFVNSFKGVYSLFHLSAFVSTYALIETDVDSRIFSYFKEHRRIGQLWFRPAEVTGVLIAPVLGGSLYFIGKKRENNHTLTAGYAVLQASLTGYLYTSFLKGITGRAYPNMASPLSDEKLSRKFDFGFLKNGIGWGWPSGHTMATVTSLSAVTAMYPDKKLLKISSAALLAYTMVSVSATGGEYNKEEYIMHWFSDGVAAALIGYTIGTTVGKYYYNKLYKNSDETTTFFYPMIYGNAVGIGLTKAF